MERGPTARVTAGVEAARRGLEAARAALSSQAAQAEQLADAVKVGRLMWGLLLPGSPLEGLVVVGCPRRCSCGPANSMAIWLSPIGRFTRLPLPTPAQDCMRKTAAMPRFLPADGAGADEAPAWPLDPVLAAAKCQLQAQLLAARVKLAELGAALTVGAVGTWVLQGPGFLCGCRRGVLCRRSCDGLGLPSGRRHVGSSRGSLLPLPPPWMWLLNLSVPPLPPQTLCAGAGGSAEEREGGGGHV